MQFFPTKKPSLLITILLPAALFFSPLPPVEGSGRSDSLESRLERRYRDVPAVMENEEVHQLIKSGRIPSEIYLLDTRSPEEWEVSRLPGATFVDYRKFSVEQLAHIPTDATIVLYCAAGRRSGNVGEALREAGYTDVRDMYGGILLWAEEGYPLVNDDGPVDRVHGSRRWYGNRLENPEVEVVY